MPNTLKKLRFNAYQQQQGLCIYCEKPMWLKDVEAFAKQQSITPRQAKKFQCTAEHLIARKDGGKDTASNIVAACHYCNQARHKRMNALDPLSFKNHVMKSVRQNKWNLDIPFIRLSEYPQKHSPEVYLH